MMKADVLSGMDKIKVCTAYEYQGEKIDHLPYSIEEEYVKPIYQEFKGWKEDITKVNKVEALPKALKDYIAFIEKEVNVPVTIVSVGPRSEERRVGKECRTRWRREEKNKKSGI